MALRKMQDPQVDLSAEDDNNEEQEEILDLREENKEAVEEKAPVLDLHNDNNEEVEDEKESVENLREKKSEHRRKFEERLARMEQEKDIEKAEVTEKQAEVKDAPPATLDLSDKEEESVDDHEAPVKDEEGKEKEKIKEQINRLEHQLEELEDGESSYTSPFAKAMEDKEASEDEQEADRAKEIVKPAVTVSEPVDQIVKPKVPAVPQSKPKEILEFPKDFLWGTATSAYQIEGNNKNDWSQWERSWPRLNILMQENKRSEDYICDQACDSYNRYEEDLDLAKALNNNAVRIGIEWSRIEPEEGTWNIEAINHYRDVLAAARERNLQTVVTLWHWTNPLWFSAEGGWTSDKAIDSYLRYVDLAIKEFGAYIDYWITLNEPMLLANYSYLLGKFPPQKHSYFKFKMATKNLIEAHKKAYKIIHKHFPEAKVSITNLSNVFEPKRKWSLPGAIIALVARRYGLDKFFNKIGKYIDFIGIDYYRKIYIISLPPFMDVKSEKLTDMGWEIYPQGIYEVIKYLSKHKKPMLILENGLADAQDKYRADFIKEHLYWVHQAISEGADVRGYFHWSLLDNFEWAHGFGPKFGLYAVDRQTMQRTPRPSAQVYADICKNNRIEI